MQLFLHQLAYAPCCFISGYRVVFYPPAIGIREEIIAGLYRSIHMGHQHIRLVVGLFFALVTGCDRNSSNSCSKHFLCHLKQLFALKVACFSFCSLFLFGGAGRVTHFIFTCIPGVFSQITTMVKSLPVGTPGGQKHRCSPGADCLPLRAISAAIVGDI